MPTKQLNIALGSLYEEVEKIAQERETSMAAFVREAVHDHIHSDRLPKRDDLSWIKFLLGKHHENMSRIGNNLNQLVLRFHEIKVLDPESLEALLKESQKSFGDLCMKLIEAEGRFGRL